MERNTKGSHLICIFVEGTGKPKGKTSNCVVSLWSHAKTVQSVRWPMLFLHRPALGCFHYSTSFRGVLEGVGHCKMDFNKMRVSFLPGVRGLNMLKWIVGPHTMGYRRGWVTFEHAEQSRRRGAMGERNFKTCRLTVDGQNPAPPKKPWDNDCPVHTNKQWFPMAFMVVQDFVHLAPHVLGGRIDSQCHDQGKSCSPGDRPG